MRSCTRTGWTGSTSRRWPIGSVARLGYSASAIKPTEPARTRGGTSGSVRAATRCSGHTEGPTSLTDPSGLGGALLTLREEPGDMRRRQAEATTRVVLPPTPLKSPEPARLTTDAASRHSAADTNHPVPVPVPQRSATPGPAPSGLQEGMGDSLQGGRRPGARRDEGDRPQDALLVRLLPHRKPRCPPRTSPPS